VPAQAFHESLERACLCAKIAYEFKAGDPVVLDMRKITPIVDYFVLATGTSRRQILAIANEIKVTLKAEKSPPLGIEGDDSSTWVLLDFGDVVVHIFAPETRAAYDLEHLWADAPRIDWQQRLGLTG
jgi:ribosome-associated protein